MLDPFKFLIMSLFETATLALDSASGSVLSSETLSAYSQSTRSCQNNWRAKQAWAESKAEARVSKRAYVNIEQELKFQPGDIS